MANYLYNGYEFPALPERDEEIYPYVSITKGAGYHALAGQNYDLAYLCFSGAPAEMGHSLCLSELTPWVTYMIDYLNGETDWQPYSEGCDSSPCPIILYRHPIIYANHDVLNEDGTLYLAASEPVPIVPTPPSAQTAFFIGKAFGRMIRNAMKPEEIPESSTPNVIKWTTNDIVNGLWVETERYNIYSFNGNEFGYTKQESDLNAPYHVIEHYDTGYRYYEFSQPFAYVEEDGVAYAKITGSSECLVYYSYEVGTSFAFSDRLSYSSWRIPWENIIWTNTDICDSDGTVKMAASEPVFVEEKIIRGLVRVSTQVLAAEQMETIEQVQLTASVSGETLVYEYYYIYEVVENVFVLYLDLTGDATSLQYLYIALEDWVEGETVFLQQGIYMALNEDEVKSGVVEDVEFVLQFPE